MELDYETGGSVVGMYDAETAWRLTCLDGSKHLSVFGFEDIAQRKTGIPPGLVMHTTRAENGLVGVAPEIDGRWVLRREVSYTLSRVTGPFAGLPREALLLIERRPVHLVSALRADGKVRVVRAEPSRPAPTEFPACHTG